MTESNLVPETGTGGDALRKLMDLRLNLEQFAIHAICKRKARNEPLPEDILSGQLALLKRAAIEGNHAGFARADHRLHAMMIACADCPLLPELWNRVWQQLQQFHRASMAQYWPDLRVLVAEHEHLIRSVLSGDFAAAEDAIRHHLNAIWFRMAEQEGSLPLEEDPLQRAIAYLAFHFHRPVHLADIARTVSFTSAGHLSRLFVRHFGMNFRMYLQAIRLNKAAELLQDTALPVRYIAERVGYRDASRFGFHFKRQFGCAPSAYRLTENRILRQKQSADHHRRK